MNKKIKRTIYSIPLVGLSLIIGYMVSLIYVIFGMALIASLLKCEFLTTQFHPINCDSEILNLVIILFGYLILFIVTIASFKTLNRLFNKTNG